MRRSAKECKTLKGDINRRFQAENETAIKGGPIETFSAKFPPYCFTSACSDPNMRKPPERIKHNEQVSMH